MQDLSDHEAPGLEVPPAVAAVAEALSARRPLRVAFEAFAPDIVLHMGPVRTRLTPSTWINWVEYLRCCGGVSGLRAEFEHVECRSDGTVLLRGRWVGQRDGSPVSSTLSDVTYRVRGGRIVELWTSPANYTLMFGRAAGTLPGFAVPYLRIRAGRGARSDPRLRPGRPAAR